MNNLKNKKIAIYMRAGHPEQPQSKIELARLSNKLTQKLKTDEFIFSRLTRSITDLIILNRFFQQNHCRFIPVYRQLQQKRNR